MTARLGLTLAVAMLLLPATWLRGDEKSDRIAKQRAAAEAKWRKLAMENASGPIETASLIVFARIPDMRAKAFAFSLEKQYATALKALKYEGKERPWEGKLAVFVFADRSEFTDFMRKIEKKSPKEEDAGAFTFGEESQLVVGVPKGSSAEPEAQAKLELAGALLRRKMVAGDPPDWVLEGFAKATEYRAANPGNKAKGPWKPPAVPVSEIWGENLAPAARESYATYLVDYLAYGPLADQFPAFINALRADENGNTPGIDMALKAINMDVPTLTQHVRAWTKPKVVKPKK